MTSAAPVLLPEKAERFLRELGSYLSSLPGNERQEIVEEIRSHLQERAAQGASDLLAGFGNPETYAAAFIQEHALAGAIARGTSWAVGRALLAGARRASWLYLVVVLGVVHVYGVVLLGLGVMKPFFPRNVGLFAGNGRFTFGMLFGSDVPNELLGWWGVPVFVAMGLVALAGGNWALRAVGQWRLTRLRGLNPRWQR